MNLAIHSDSINLVKMSLVKDLVNGGEISNFFPDWSIAARYRSGERLRNFKIRHVVGL